MLIGNLNKTFASSSFSKQFKKKDTRKYNPSGIFAQESIVLIV